MTLAMPGHGVEGRYVGDHDEKGKTRGDCRAIVPNAVELGMFGKDDDEAGMMMRRQRRGVRV
jgi:hypothetical protein